MRVDASTVSSVAELLPQISRLEPGSPFFVAWEVPLIEGAGSAEAAAVREAGATPWISLVFTTPAPLTDNAERLQGELRRAAEVAKGAAKGTWFQIVWRPEGQEASDLLAAGYPFLLKRAAVAVTGAQTDALVATHPLPADAAAITTFYGEDVAAYLEALVLAPAPPGALAAAVAAAAEADPGRPVVLDALPVPEHPEDALVEAARTAAAGASLALFDSADRVSAPQLAPLLAPLLVMAREMSGDLSIDPSSVPTGAGEAWSFVRGEDLSLRVIVAAPQVSGPSVTLSFPDPQLRRPTRFPISSGPLPAAPSGEATESSLELVVPQPARVMLLGLDRPTAAELEGVEEKVTVASERQMPVEEILRRLQAFEDAQSRKLARYRAVNTTHLRFGGTLTVEATLKGPFFWTPQGSDWAWETLYVNGVRWRDKRLPEIPLVQPEKAAALPLAITFTKQYRYRLRGTEEVDGRDAWVVDFAPAGPTPEASKLYQGTVWIDRKLYARLKTRAVQIGLEGEVLSNEETMLYAPIDEAGRPAEWSAESFILPLHLVAQQVLSIVNATTVVERETLLTEVRINGPDFETERKQVADSESTMVRDSARGLRYLVKDDSGERVEKEGFDTTKIFAVAGVFYDDALDYPLPLAGVNYFSFDFKGTGKQLNAFFAGALLTVDFAEPRLFGSKFDAGADLFAFAIPLTDSVYRLDQDDEIEEEQVKTRTANVGFKLGRPLGNFIKLSSEYSLIWFGYGDTGDTASDFVIPSDNITHSFDLTASYNRAGYRFSASGSYNRRSTWDFWGQPGNSDFSEDKQDFLRWEARAGKNWFLPKFQKVGVELDYAGGSDLDRFSKYQFGFFGATRVHGYQSSRVRASEVFAGHASYGFEVGEFLRLEAVGDAAWATDDDTGLDNELLAGVGIQGTFMGPWRTIVNLDLGVPVAGPDDGFVLYLVFLKLFR